MALTKRSNHRMIHTKNCIMRGSNLLFSSIVCVCLCARRTKSCGGCESLKLFKNFSPSSTIWCHKPVPSLVSFAVDGKFKFKKIPRLLWHSRLTVVCCCIVFRPVIPSGIFIRPRKIHCREISRELTYNCYCYWDISRVAFYLFPLLKTRGAPSRPRKKLIQLRSALLSLIFLFQMPFNIVHDL